MTDSDNDQEEYEIERILADSVVDGETFYLVKWQGYNDEQCTWEPEDSFTSQKSIEEYQHQKAMGLSLPDEFLAGLQKKIDDFQAKTQAGQNEQAQRIPDEDAELDTDESNDRPVKRPKKRHLEDFAVPSRPKPTGNERLRKKGIATFVKPSHKQRVKAGTATTTKPKDSVPRSEKTRADRAGQRFRNLSHMNNYRKKAREEPPPNLRPDQLKPIAEFELDLDGVSSLPPVPESASRRQSLSPLFIPDTAASIDYEPSPTRSESGVFPPAKIDHRRDHSLEVRPKDPEALRLSNTARADSTSQPLMTQQQPSGHRANQAVPNSPNFIVSSANPPEVFPLAPTPPHDKIMRAFNGRTWYRGDIMCTFSMGQPIGDAAILHIPFFPFGSHILKLKTSPLLTLDFDPHALNPSEFAQRFRNRNVMPLAIGLVSPFPDMQNIFDQFAEYLEMHDSAAFFNHPHPTVNMSLLLYSLRAPSWRRIGWQPARSGRPRLHLAVVEKLIPSPSAVAATPTAVPSREMLLDTDTARRSSASSRAGDQPKTTSDRPRQAPEFQQNLEELDLRSMRSPSSIAPSEMYRSSPGSPQTDYTSGETSPLATTPRSPATALVSSRDPRLNGRIKPQSSPRNDEVLDKSQISKSSNTRGTWAKLDYNYITAPVVQHARTRPDPTKISFFISFSELHADDALAMQRYLEQKTAPSNIYLDSQTHDWVRFAEKAGNALSILFFHDEDPNYHKLDGLGQLLLSEHPRCFSVSFHRGGHGELGMRVKKIFPRLTWYLITETMIIDYLRETMAIANYFADTKKPGYKIFTRPQIKGWLLEYTSRQEEGEKRDTLMELLVLISKLNPSISVEGNTLEDFQSAADHKSHKTMLKPSFVVSPDTIPGYDDIDMAPHNKPMTPVRDSDASHARVHRDRVLRSYYYCCAATSVDNARKFLDFVPREQFARHQAAMRQKQEEGTFDCGHICIYELQKFVAKYCQRKSNGSSGHAKPPAPTK